jgi:hypothetical protein
MVILSIYNLIGIKSESTVPIWSRTIPSTQEHLTPTSHILGLNTPSTTTHYAIIDNVSVQYSNHTSLEQLKNWSKLCKVSRKSKDENNIQINCIVVDGSYLMFLDFRDLTSKLSSDISIDLFVVCVGGYIRFPWPFRADKLNRIHIENCTIKDLRKEYKTASIDTIPDTVKYLVMENVKIVLTMKDIFDTLVTVNSSLSRAAECGPENAVSITRRNISIKIVDIHNFLNANNIIEHNRQFHIQKKTCLYKNLEYFEISEVTFLKKNTVDKIAYTDDAHKLKVLNFSRCGMSSTTLYKFNNWRLRFPEMEYLDFSHNVIKAVPDVIDYGYKKIDSPIGIIDLRHNNISCLSKHMVNSFSNHKFVKVDIRDNPYHCDCDTIGTVQYLKSKIMPEQYNYLKSLQCESPANVKGRLIISLSLDELQCRKDNILNIPAIIICVAMSVLFTTIAILYFRKVIKDVLFTRLNIRLSCHAKTDTNDEQDCL